MQFLTMGANAPLDDDQVTVTLRWPVASGILDASIYMLGSDGRVRGDHDMIFYNQRSDADHAVHIASIGPDTTEMRIDFTRVPDAIDRIVICATVDQPGRTMAGFVGTVIDAESIGIDGIRFEPDLSQASEVAMRLVEVYRRSGRWRIRAIGQGFDSGLDALARSFGVDISDGEDVSGDAAPQVDSLRTPQAAEQSAPEPPVDSPAADHRPRDSDRVYDNDLPSIGSETVGDLPLPPILLDDSTLVSADRPEHVWPQLDNDIRTGLIIEMLWQSRIGGVHGRARYLELELGCFYEMVDGTRGLLQIWDGRGHIDRAPFIRLEGSKMADGKGCQKLAIAGGHRAKIKRLQLYAFIPDGAANWAMASVAMTATLGDHPPVSMAIDKGQDGHAIVAMMTIDQTQQSVVATYQAQFAWRHPELDALLGWGMSWKTRPSPYAR